MPRIQIRSIAVCISICFVALCLPTATLADDAKPEGVVSGFSDGRWRIEAGAATGFHSGRRDRSGDVLVTGNVEYEWPVYARCTLGLRAYPLFMYKQNDP